MENLAAELDAVQSIAGMYALNDRAFLRITGPDATRWLNGMVTNSIRDLAPREGSYNFLLNAQGRIEGDCDIYRTSDNAQGDPEFLLATSAAQLDTIEALLERFIIMDDVELSRGLTADGAGAERGLGVVGGQADCLLLEAMQNLDPSLTELPAAGHMVVSDANESSVIIFSPPVGVAFSGIAQRFEVWSQNGALLDRLRDYLLAKGVLPASDQVLEAMRILAGRPRYGVDIRNNERARDLPQETAQTHALHFNKGCYLGQEIVERIRSRGQVHRAFTRFTLTGAMPALPAALTATLAGQTRPAGELTSAVDVDGTLHALGYLRREFATQPLSYDGGSATPMSATRRAEDTAALTTTSQP